MRSNRLLLSVVMVLVFALLLLTGTASAVAANSRYLVTAPHTKEECLKALDEVQATGTQLLSKTDWGCMAGDHTAYVILEAKNEAALKKMVPASWGDAKIVKLNKFTAKEIESFHSSMK